MAVHLQDSVLFPLCACLPPAMAQNVKEFLSSSDDLHKYGSTYAETHL
jgi:hypothetical protein